MRRYIIVISIVFLFIITLNNDAFSAPSNNKVKKKNKSSHTVVIKQHKSGGESGRLSSIKLKKSKNSKRLAGKSIKAKSMKTRWAHRSIQEQIEITENDGEFTEYRTKRGDTLDKISAMFNVDKNDILEANNLTGKKLSPRKVILIPKAIEEVTEEEKDEEFITLPNNPLKPWKNTEEKYMLVKVAKSFVGAPYKYGGESVRGLDCSAFVKKIYDIFDVQLPRSAREQFNAGLKIDKNALLVGDLVFFKTKRYAKYPTHVGIFIGDGNFIHSSSGHNRLGVKIDSLSSDFYSRTYIGATRVKHASEEKTETSNAVENAENNS